MAHATDSDPKYYRNRMTDAIADQERVKRFIAVSYLPWSPTPRREEQWTIPTTSGQAGIPTRAATPTSSTSNVPQGEPSSTAPAIDEGIDGIERLRGLPRNWDGEGALPLTDDVIDRGKRLLAGSAEVSSVSGWTWRNPDVGPSPDGALELSWEVGDRWTLAVIEPHQTELTIVSRTQGSPARTQKLNEMAAIVRILWTLRDQ